MTLVASTAVEVQSQHWLRYLVVPTVEPRNQPARGRIVTDVFPISVGKVVWWVRYRYRCHN